MVDQSFLNNAKSLMMMAPDEWTRNFAKSLLDQVSAGRNLSEKQIAIFNTKLECMMHPPLKIEVKIDPEFMAKIQSLKEWSTSAWLDGFLESIEKQLKMGRPLTGKQNYCFQKAYDRFSGQNHELYEFDWLPIED